MSHRRKEEDRKPRPWESDHAGGADSFGDWLKRPVGLGSVALADRRLVANWPWRAEFHPLRQRSNLVRWQLACGRHLESLKVHRLQQQTFLGFLQIDRGAAFAVLRPR